MTKKTSLDSRSLGELIYNGAKSNTLNETLLKQVKDISKISKYFEYFGYGYYRVQPIHFAIEHNNIKLAGLLTMLDPKGLTDQNVYNRNFFFPGSYTPCGLVHDTHHNNQRNQYTTPDDSDRPRTSPLRYAIELKRWELLIEIVSLYPFGNLRNILGYALIKATQDNKEDVVRFLLEAGANSEYCVSRNHGNEKKNSLHYAAEMGNENIIKMLIEHNPNLVHQGNPTPLNLSTVSFAIKNYITQILLSLSPAKSIPIATRVDSDLKQPSAPNDPISIAEPCSPEEVKDTHLPVAQAEPTKIDMKLCRLRTLYTKQWNSAFFTYSSKNMGERLRTFKTYEEAETFIRDNPKCKRTKSIMNQLAEENQTSNRVSL